MRINKSLSRYLAFGMVILVIITVVLLGRGANKTVSKLPSIELLKNKDGTFEASVVFGEFQKSEIKDGKKQWEIYSKVGRYRPQDGKAELEEPVVTLYRENDVITLTATKGIVFLESTQLNNVEVVGNVIITSQANKTTINAEQINYDKKSEELKAFGPVKIESDSMVTTGDDLIGNTEVNNFKILNNVQTVIKPKKS